MYFWMLLGCLAVGGAGWALSRRFDRAGQALMAVGALGCVGLIAWQGFQAVGDRTAPRVHRSQAAVAYMLAHHFLGNDESRSGDVVLIFPPDDAAPPAALDSFFEGFARVIARFPGLGLKEVQVLFSRSSDVPSLTDFEVALGSGEGVVAYVSWVGFPDGAETLPVFRDPGSRPSIYVFDSSGRTNWFPHVASGLIQAGVIERSDSGSSVDEIAGPATPDKLFARDYRLVTGANVSARNAEF